MAETIWKYPVKPNSNGLWKTKMPEGARILSVQVQSEEPQMWALVDPDRPPELRSFYVPGTGHEHMVPSGDLEFIDTFQLGWTVWHVFEVTR